MKKVFFPKVLLPLYTKNTMNHDYSEESVNILLDWAENVQFPKTLRLSKSEDVYDLPRCVQANINDIKIHYPNPTFIPAIDRLYRIKEALEVEKQL